MSVHRTYRTSQVTVVTSREGPVSRSQIISMFMKSNMHILHIFEQCSQWQPDIDTHAETYLCMKLGGDEMKEETYGCDTQVWVVMWLGTE